MTHAHGSAGTVWQNVKESVHLRETPSWSYVYTKNVWMILTIRFWAIIQTLRVTLYVLWNISRAISVRFTISLCFPGNIQTKFDTQSNDKCTRWLAKVVIERCVLVVELGDDPIIHSHLQRVYENLFEANLLRLIEPFSRVQIEHIAKLIDMPKREIENKYVWYRQIAYPTWLDSSPQLCCFTCFH